MLFTVIMRKKYMYSVVLLTILLLATWYLSTTNNADKEFSERVKVAMREVGNQLLLADQDSTSLVMPVVALKQNKHQLSFQNQLSIAPKNLVRILQESFKITKLPSNYRIEVLQCSDDEVAYSYEMINTQENSIIPCFGRVLPKKCYRIEVKFLLEKKSFYARNKAVLYSFISGVLVLLFYFYFDKKTTKDADNETGNSIVLPKDSDAYIVMGSFHFYPTQNKMLREGLEIKLSNKECELLTIFAESPNTTITRDELMKRVWEDKGVIVGRSLDTYISKLRKKLKEDTTIQLTNVHGIGYILAIDNS